MGIVHDSILLLLELATNLVLLGRKCVHLMGLFLPGHIIRCKHNGTRSATGTHHAGPSPLACLSLLHQPITLKSTSLEAVIVAAPPLMGAAPKTDLIFAYFLFSP
jgi:hypothetical protein